WIKTALKWKELEEYVLKQVKLFSDLDRYALNHKDRKPSEKVVLEIDRKILPRGFIFKLLVTHTHTARFYVPLSFF
ncbi:unnamed protein product, partial [marine sediment metagenome]